MMFSDTYKTIGIESEGIYKDKGSKFLAFAFPVKNEHEIKEHLSELRKKYYDARHHCYAYALGPSRDAYRINDDGEPSGTAGKPIYGQILSYDITNILIVVVRYFGGVKLGVRGLINAYRAAATDAIENNVIEEKIIREIYELQFEYPQMNDVMRIIKEQNLEQVSQDFQMNCRLTFSVRKTKADVVVPVFKSLHGINLVYKHTI
jgi:uncharacterized YigZ family protein